MPYLATISVSIPCLLASIGGGGQGGRVPPGFYSSPLHFRFSKVPFYEGIFIENFFF